MKIASENEDNQSVAWESLPLAKTVGEDGLFCDGDWVETKDQDPDGKVRLIQLADIGKGIFLDKSDRYLTHEKALELNCTFLQPGDVLVSRMAEPIGRACILPPLGQPAVTAVDIVIIRVGEEPAVLHEWLVNVCNSPGFHQAALQDASGSTRKRISRSNLGALQVPVPPLPTQRRIAARLDALTTRADRARDHLESIPPLVDQFKKSLLARAYTGELTADWRANNPDVEPAAELLKRIRVERKEKWIHNYAANLADRARKRNEKKGKTFTDDDWQAYYDKKIPQGEDRYEEPEPVDPENEDLPEIPETWEWVRLGELFEWSNGTALTEDEREGGDFPVYGGNGISGAHSLPIVEHPTLIIGRVGAHCGNVHVSNGACWVTDNAIFATVVPNDINIDFIRAMVQLRNLNAEAGGSGQPYVNQSLLDEVIVPFPPETEQMELTRRSNEFSRTAEVVAAKERDAYYRIEQVRSSILSTTLNPEQSTGSVEL